MLSSHAGSTSSSALIETTRSPHPGELERSLGRTSRGRARWGANAGTRSDFLKGMRVKVPGHLVRPIIHCVQRLVPLSSSAETSFEAVRDEDWVPLIAFDRWMSHAAQRLGKPALGVEWRGRSPNDARDIVELSAQSAPTFDSALDVLSTLGHVVCEVSELYLHVLQGHAVLEMRYTIPLSIQTRDFLCGELVRMAKMVLGETAQLGVWLTGDRATAHSAYHYALSPSAVTFGSRLDAIVFPASALGSPLPRADAVTHAVLLRAAAEKAAARRTNETTANAVKRCFDVPEPRFEANEIARSLGTSKRTLARRLRDEGTSLRALVEEFRQAASSYYMAQTAGPLSLLAAKLGYQSTATLCRAFLRWHGVSPMHYRREAVAQSARSAAIYHAQLHSDVRSLQTYQGSARSEVVSCTPSEDPTTNGATG